MAIFMNLTTDEWLTIGATAFLELAISGLICGFLLRFAINRFEGVRLSYMNACLSIWIALAICYGTLFLLTAVTISNDAPPSQTDGLIILMLPLAFLVQSSVIQFRHKLRFRRAFLFTSIVFGIYFVARLLFVAAASLLSGQPD